MTQNNTLSQNRHESHKKNYHCDHYDCSIGVNCDLCEPFTRTERSKRKQADDGSCSYGGCYWSYFFDNEKVS